MRICNKLWTPLGQLTVLSRLSGCIRGAYTSIEERRGRAEERSGGEGKKGK